MWEVTWTARDESARSRVLRDVTKLEALGFEPGDPLDRIPSVEYEKVGFKYCEWGRVVKADKAHRLLAKAWH